MNGTLVPTHCRILRLPRPPPDFVPDSWRPTHKQFEPSSEDEQTAKEKNQPVRVSVWDNDRTTARQAQDFRGEESIVLRLSVQAVVEISTDGPVRLSTVYDPLEKPDCEKAGADGHAGIEGLKRPSGAKRMDYETCRQRLAEKCVVVDPAAE